MRQLVLIFLLISYCCILISCNQEDQQKFEFFYYPSRNVYFDVTNNVFLFSVDGGQTWDSVDAVTDNQPAILGDRKIVYSTTHAVWIDNSEHRHEFNGRLIDVTKTFGDQPGNSDAADRKVKQTVSTTPSEKKPEKKLNFFQRLFGKKNKDKNDKN